MVRAANIDGPTAKTALNRAISEHTRNLLNMRAVFQLGQDPVDGRVLTR